MKESATTLLERPVLWTDRLSLHPAVLTAHTATSRVLPALPAIQPMAWGSSEEKFKSWHPSATWGIQKKLLALDRLSFSYYGHLGSKPADRRLTSLLFVYLMFK